MKRLLFLSTLLVVFVGVFFMQAFKENEKLSGTNLGTNQPRITTKEFVQPYQDFTPEENLSPKKNGADSALNDRDRKVSDRLNKFLVQTASMTAEGVARERENISRGLQEIYTRQEKMPNSSRITDEHGDQWEKLKFENGVVRYIPLPEGGKNL